MRKKKHGIVQFGQWTKHANKLFVFSRVRSRQGRDTSARLAVMHSFYLRKLYQQNLLAKPRGISLAGTPIDLSKIRTPTFILSTREDHIAPWKSTYATTRLYFGPIKFVLSASGHMAGVISAPGSKCGHWANDNLPPSPDEWFADATPHLGSWWPVWDEWVTQLDSGRVPAREPGGGKLTTIEDAPSYVRVRSAAQKNKVAAYRFLKRVTN